MSVTTEMFSAVTDKNYSPKDIYSKTSIIITDSINDLGVAKIVSVELGLEGVPTYLPL